METAFDVSVNGSMLHGVVVGDGTPLLVVHGGMGYGLRGFRPWLDPLGEQYQLIYVDLPGNGGSEEPADFDTWDTLAPLAASLEGLRRELGHETWHVLGHSFGGVVVQEYGLTYPDRLRSLVISCSTPRMDHHEESMAAARERCTSDAQFHALRDRLLAPRRSDEEYDAIWAEVWPAYFADPAPVERGELRAATGGSAAAFNTTLRIWPNIDFTERAAALSSTSVLTIGAALDWTFPPAVGPRRLHTLIDGSEYVEFAHSGHYPFIEEQDRFLATMADWLQRH